MSYSISYQEKAVQEYEAATEWYRERSERAVENFAIAVKEKVEVLKQAPTTFKRTYRHFHEVALKRYPYSLIYIIDEKNKQVIISSIYHHKRSPRKKFR